MAYSAELLEQLAIESDVARALVDAEDDPTTPADVLTRLRRQLDDVEDRIVRVTLSQAEALRRHG